MTSVQRSFAYSLADGYVGIAVQLVATMALSRLLRPAEIGVFATAAVLTALAGKLRDFGISEYLIQERDISQQKIAAAFTVNLIASWLVGASVFAASPLAAMFFGEYGVGEVMRLQAVGFFLIPFGALSLAWHHRALNFRPIFVAGASSAVVSACVSVACATAGFGYMGLAYGSIAGVVTTVAVALVVTPVGLRLRLTRHGLSDVLRFGRHLSGIFVLGQIGRSAPEIVIAKVLDFSAVAFFSRAAGVVDLFNQAVMRAVSLLALPYLSADARQFNEAPVRAFLEAKGSLMAIGWPFFACLSLMAEPVVYVVYGAQWEPAVPLVRILSAVAACELAMAMYKDLLIASGLASVATRLEASVQTVRLIGLAPLVPFGTVGACTGLLAASLVNLYVVYRRLGVLTGLAKRDVIPMVVPNVWVTLYACIPSLVWLTARGFVGTPLIEGAIICGVVTPFVWFAALKLTSHPLHGHLVAAWNNVKARK